MTSSLESLAQNLLDRVGFNKPFTLLLLPGGRNNRVFRLESTGKTFLFKQYFYSPDDPRDRLKHEYHLLEYLCASGSTYVARPYAADPANHVALMEFIEGTRIELADVSAFHVDQAIEFFRDLNRRKFSEAARALPSASEACFSLTEHLNTTQRRVDRLKNISSKLPVDYKAQQFIRNALMPLWFSIRLRIESEILDDKILLSAERCLSPSDFGFHNALHQVDGSVKFVDFEYAGWDDPAKLVADFANQPDMTLDRQYSDRFKNAVIETHHDPEKLRRRIALLEPLYQVKWACICLNDFLPIGESRRNFVGVEEETRKSFQLERAKKMLDRAFSS